MPGYYESYLGGMEKLAPQMLQQRRLQEEMEQRRLQNQFRQQQLDETRNRTREIQRRSDYLYGGNPQPTPQPTPQPSNLGVEPGDQQPSTQMPPEIASAPPGVRNQWILKNRPAGGMDAQMTPEALKNAAHEMLFWGKEPKGFGQMGQQTRITVANERGRLAQMMGLSPIEVAMLPKDNDVKMKAVGALTKWGAFVDKSAQQLLPSIDLAIEYSKKLGPTQMQLLNKAILAGRSQFNDPDANAYAVAVNTVRREYGRLMSGPTSNAMLPVEAMKSSDSLISNALDEKAWNEVKNVVLRDAKITSESVRGQVDRLRGSITGMGKESPATSISAPPSSPQQSARKPISQMTNAELMQYRRELSGQK